MGTGTRGRAEKRRSFSDERFDPTMGRQSAGVLSGRSTPANAVRRAESANRRDPAGDVHRLDRARHRIQLQRCITADTPCAINGIVTQRDGNYLEGGGEGFIEPHADSVRSASRYGVGAQPENRHPCRGRVVPRRHRRRVRAARRRRSRIPSEPDDLLHRLRLRT